MPIMPALFWTLFLCVGLVLVSAQTTEPNNGIPKPGEIFPGIAFDELMQMFADVLNKNTLKGSLGEACESARQIMDAVSSLYSSSKPSPTTGSIEEYIDSICSHVEESLASGTDVDIHEEVCELLELANMDYHHEYSYNYVDYQNYHSEEYRYIHIREGYRWLLNSFLLLTFDSSWSSPWRYNLVSPRQLLAGAFKMDLEAGSITNCDQMTEELKDLTGKEFLDRAIRNSFFEALRNRHFPRSCEVSNNETYYHEKEDFTYRIIDMYLAYFIGRDCTVLSNSLDDFENGDRTAIDEILNLAKDNYYSSIFDDIACQMPGGLLDTYKELDPDHFEEAIANYTGFSHIWELCNVIHNMYWNDGHNADVKHGYINEMSHYGYHYLMGNDPTSQYTSLLSLSSRFLSSNSTISALNAVCGAFNDFDTDDKQLCIALSAAETIGDWEPLTNICERDFIQRCNHDIWWEKYHANQPFNIIFNSFFLFTFNGDWEMPHRYEFISITKLLRQAFDLWPNYNTICQTVDEALDQPGNELIKGAIMHTFEYYIRDHFEVVCETFLSNYAYTTTTRRPRDEIPATDNHNIETASIMGDTFRYLLNFVRKREMCASLIPYTVDDTKRAAEQATTSFLEILKDERKCQELLDIHQYKEGFLDSIYLFTGYTGITDFCRYLIQTFSERSPEINSDRFRGKELLYPYDVCREKGEVFKGVNYNDLLPVAVNLMNSATVRDGLILLCDTFVGALDYGRRDYEICDVLKSEQRNFGEECEKYKLLTEDSGESHRQLQDWPWIEFNRWLPNWFYDFSGFDHIYYMYYTDSLPMNLNLSHILNRVLSFSDSSPREVCNHLIEIVLNEDDTLTIKDVLDQVIDYTLGQLSRMASTLCLAHHLPMPDEFTPEKHSTTTPTNDAKLWWPYNQTHWQHLYLGPVKGPMVGMLFAYLTGYEEADLMCKLLRTEDNIDTDILKTNVLESLRKVRTDSWSCRMFIAFIDRERQKKHKDVPILAEEVGYESTSSMCEAVVGFFKAGDTELNFDWSNVTNHYKYYYPEEWNPRSKAEVLPGVSFKEFAQMVGNIYNKTLRNSLKTACRILRIESHNNDFPFEYELCMLVSDLAGDDQPFREYCYLEASQYQTYFDHMNPNIEHNTYYDHNAPNIDPIPYYDNIDEDQSWTIPPELTALNDFAEARFGLDMSNPYSVCEVGGEMLTLSMDEFLETISDGLSLAITALLIKQYDLICTNDIDMDGFPSFFSSGSYDFPNDFPAHLLAVLADYQSSEEFCIQLSHLPSISGENDGTCVEITDDPGLQDIATKIVSNTLLVIKDTTVCVKVADIFFEYFRDILPSATGYDNSNTICSAVVDALTQRPDTDSYNPPIIPSNVAEMFDTFEPLREPGQILPFLTFDETVDLFGHLFNQPSLYAIFAYVCEHYNNTLHTLGDVPDEITKACIALNDDGDINNVVSMCKEIMIPLTHGSDYPIGLRQINPLFDIQKSLLNLAGENTVMNNSAVTSAIEHLINSDMSLTDLINRVFDDIIPNVLQSANDICDDWQAVDVFLKSGFFESVDSVSSDSRVDAMWELAATLSGYVTSLGEFDCVTLQRELATDASAVTDDLKTKFWSYMEDSKQCEAAVDSIMRKYGSSSSEENPFGGSDGNPFSDSGNTPSAMLTYLTGYSNGQELCQAFVNLVSIEENCNLAICTSDYDPQCGTDGQTYSNMCLLRSAMCSNSYLQLQHAGECRSENCDLEICTRDYDPQCGTNGQTYSNLCLLQSAMCSNSYLQLQHAGECRSEPICTTMIDCTGKCGGSALEDCSGTCNGDAVRDCNGDCQGTAIVNGCGYCVNGNTGRAGDFGRDKCGVCISSDDSYRLQVDCNGDCNGEADYDECGECVGGNTGKARDINDRRLDCFGECDGTWLEDTCGVCGPRFEGRYGSLHKDCSGICHPPGTDSNDMALLNMCNECIGGTTGRDETFGVNECGACGQDLRSCTGCDGVPNSGEVEDECGICGGGGTSCVKVSGIHPTIAPSGQDTQFVIKGAGFIQAGIKCVFNLDDGSTREVTGVPDGPQMIVCGDVQLAAGLYQVTVEVEGTAIDEAIQMVIFDSGIVLSMTPTEINLQENLESFQLTFAANDAAAFANVKTLFQQSPNFAGLLVLDMQLSAEGYTWTVYGYLSEESENEIIFNVDQMPARSLKVRLFPTFGSIKLPTPGGNGFVFTFYAMAPVVQSSAFDSSGTYVMVRFEPGVNNKEINACYDIFEETSKLGVSPKCTWIDPRQLQITVGGDGLIQVGASLTFKENTLSTFGEVFSRTASGTLIISAPDDPILPIPHIHGNTEISSCGMLRLSAKGSTGGGGRDMSYQWSVCRSPEGSGSVLDSSTDARDVVIEGSNLLADQVYGLCLELSNFLKRGSQDIVRTRVDVRRSSADEPEVVIISPGANVVVSKSFTLTAQVTFTECFTPSEVSFEWSVNDDTIPLNLKTRKTPVLFVDKQTLPGDRDLEFTVKVSLSSDSASFVERSTTISTIYSDLQAMIDKPPEVTIGRLSGDFALDAYRSRDPDNVALEMRYRWRCLQVTDYTPCFIKGGNGETFPSSEESERDVIVLDPLQMFPDVSYELTLEISKGSRRDSTSVLIHVVNGQPPEIIITSATRRKIQNTEKTLQLEAVVRSPDTDVDVISWQAIQREGYGYVEFHDVTTIPQRSFENGYTSQIRVRKGILAPGIIYVFQVTACIADNCGEAVVEVETLPIVTSCVLSIAGGNSYTVLDKITFEVERCATKPSAYPLSFQMYRLIDDSRNMETLTEKQNFPVFETIGKPARDGTSENTFFTKVCNSYSSCSWFDVTASVTPRSDLTPQQVTKLTEEFVDTLKLTKNYLGALVNYNIISDMANKKRRRKRAVTVSTPRAAEQIELMENTVENTVLDYSNAQLLIDQLASVNIAELSHADRSRLLHVIHEIVMVFDGENPIESKSAQIILDVTGVIAEDSIPDQRLVISTINSMLVTSQATELTLGADATVTSSSHVTNSIQRVIPTGVFRTKSGSGGAYVHFGTQIAARYGPIWSCSAGDTCSGVVIHYEHYETQTDYLSTTNDDRINRAADIIGISLHDPGSDSELDITGLTTPITINITITRPQTNKSYECRYWSQSEMAWLSHGIETIIQTSTIVTCFTDHLTHFTVMAVDPPTTTESMVSSTEIPGRPREKRGGLSAALTALVVLVVLFIVAILIIIIIYFKKSKKSKVVPVDNEPERVEEAPEQPDDNYSPSPPPPFKPPSPDELPHGNTFEPQDETRAATASTKSPSDDERRMRDSPRLDQPSQLTEPSTSSSDSYVGQTDPEQDMGESPPLYPPLKLILPIRKRLSTVSTESSMTLPDPDQNNWESPTPYEFHQTPIPEDEQAPLNKTRVWTSQNSSCFDESQSLEGLSSANSSNPRTSRLRSESLASTASTVTPPPIYPVRSSNRPKTARKKRTGLPNISS